MSTDQAAVATVETLEDKDQSTTVRLWLDAIGIASNEEQTWRKQGQTAFDLYRASGDKDTHKDSNKKFNILHANVETLVPALYNSTPIPDVRRRFNDTDPIAKTVADIQERCLAYSVESYDFDHLMKLAVSDSEICGRSVDRVRYKPYVSGGDPDDPAEGTEVEAAGEQLAYQELICEHVPWKQFRRGPGYQWDDVAWIAFELFLTRDELVKLSPKFGHTINLDVSVNKPDDKSQDRDIPEIFKRARVWEIWDKDQRKVLFIAESHKSEPIREENDPLELEGFFPIPRPLYAVSTSNSLIPVVPYEIYKAQAEELELVSARIMALTEAVKAKALYDARISEMERLEKAEDTDNIPIENISIFADGSKLADHIFFYPIEVLVVALEKLYLARDQIKQTIYEITGISDILRGKSEASETATAQQIKSNWGSLRIQNKQQEIARYARDIFRIKAELFATKFEPQFLEMMTGIKLMPSPQDPPEVHQQAQAVMQMMRSDKLRGFRVDVESDSTIRADLSRNQQNMTLFLQGVAQYAQSMGPIVMTDKSLLPAAMEVFVAFSRNFKLGKQAEDAIEKVIQQAQQVAQQPPQPSREQQLEQQKMQMEQQKLQNDMQAKQAEMQMKAQETQTKLAADQQANEQKLQFEAAKHEQEMQFEREKHQSEMQMRAHELQQNAELKQQEIASTGQLKREEMAVTSHDKAQDRQASAQEGEATRQHDTAKIEAPIIAEKKQLAEVLGTFVKRFESVIEHMNAPRELVRGKDGRAVGSVSKPPKIEARH